MPGSRIAVSLAAVALALSLPATGLAQEPSEQVTDTTAAPDVPTAITAADMVTMAEENSTRLRATRGRIQPLTDITALVEELPSVIAGIDSLLADSASLAPELLSRRQLTSLHLIWDRYSRQLGDWQGILSERAQQLGEEQDSVAAMRAVWEVTSDTAAAAGYPEAAIGVIGSALALIDSVEAEIRVRFDTVLSLQNTVSELRGSATEVLDGIQTAQSQAQLHLFTPESPPLWQAIISPGELSWTHVMESFQQDFRELSMFWTDADERIPVQVATLLAILVAILLLRRRSKHLIEEDPDIEKSAQILDRPFSVLLLIALLTMRTFHPQLPVVVVDLARLLALIPALRLLPALVHPALRRPLYGFAALWLFNDLLNILPEASTLHRVGTLLVAAASLAGLVWTLRNVADGVVESRRRRARFVLQVSRLGVVTLSGSIIGNVLGFVDLSHMLLDATLLSALIALGLFAAAVIVEALVHLLIRTRTAQSIASVRRHSNLLVRRVIEIARAAAFIMWFTWTLSAFGLLRPLVSAGMAVLMTPLNVGSLSISLGNIVAFFLAIYVAVLASRLTRFLLEQDVYPRLTLPRGVPGAVTKVSQYLIIGLGLMIAFAASGFDLSSLALLAGALGVGIGFGLQAIVNNFVSGLILIFERPVQVGDAIQLDTLTGTVTNIGIRASTVRTFDGAEVIVPNADMITGRVTNWTLSDRLRRIEIQVGVSYDSDPRRVGELLLEVAKQQPDCLKDPEPYVLFDRFGDSALEFIVRFWTSDYSNWLEIESQATYAVHDALKAEGIQIPFPQRDVHLKSREDGAES
jgi:small-conductance mechanosensitive channel